MRRYNTTFIFYFPFSIFPGFWVDGGVEFKSFCSQLEGQNQNKYTNRFIFIGPKPEGILAKSIFEIISTQTNDELIKIFRDVENIKFPNFINAKDNANSSLIEQIKNSYRESYNSIKGLANLKKFVHVIEIDSPQNLPSSSFVLEINGEQNLVYVDTFKILMERLPPKIYDMEMDRFQIKQSDNDGSKKRKFEDLSMIFATPTSFYFKNNIVSNLFFSSFLNICRSNRELASIIDIINNNNENQN